MIVTGASSGIGAALSAAGCRRRLSARGRRAPRLTPRRPRTGDSRTRRDGRAACRRRHRRTRCRSESYEPRSMLSDASTSSSTTPVRERSAHCSTKATPRSKRSGSSTRPRRFESRAPPSPTSKRCTANSCSSARVPRAFRFRNTAPTPRQRRRFEPRPFSCGASCAARHLGYLRRSRDSSTPSSIRPSASNVRRRCAPPIRNASRDAILRGIARRAAVVNGVPWQTAGTVLGEWFGTLADPVIVSRFSARRTLAVSDAFDRALEPIARRLERVKLPTQFLRDALVPGTTLSLNNLAMRWAGMPNKNERAAMREALDALDGGGFPRSGRGRDVDGAARRRLGSRGPTRSLDAREPFDADRGEEEQRRQQHDRRTARSAHVVGEVESANGARRAENGGQAPSSVRSATSADTRRPPA